MKVVRPGTAPVWQSEPRYCGCDAILVAEAEDILWFCREGYDWTGDANGPQLKGIKCPFCSRYHEIKDAPNPIRK